MSAATESTTVIHGAPPGPTSALWQLIKWGSKPLDTFQEHFRRHGDPFTMPFFEGVQLVCTAEPDGIREIFMADPDTFEVPTPEMLTPLVGRNSVLVLSGQRHRRERQMMAPPFHGARMRAYGKLMQDIALKHGARWEKGKPFTMLQTTQAISLEVILQAVFGVTEPERVRIFEEAILAFVRTGTPLVLFFKAVRKDLGPWSPWGRLKRAEKHLFALIQEEIENRRKDHVEREDILSMLLAARREDGSPMADEVLRDELLTLLVAGHETTASALAWAFYLLHRNPDVLARLQAELRGLGPTPDAMALAEHPYLDAVCSETLRIRPIVMDVARLLRKPMVLRGREIPAGHGVCAAIVATHHDARIYPEPHAFRPERFLERKFSPYEFLPFGGGVRRCLGASFALYEMKIVLGSLLGQKKLALASDKAVVPGLRNVTWAPTTGVRMVLRD
ncbi:MAG: cytochrome P450 [Myxococcota bacterium]